MRQFFRRGAATIAAGILGAAVIWSSALAQGEPPGRVGRLAFTDGTVSFHDDEQSGWTQAVVNTPLTTGDGLWTEPDARSEISLAGTRIRMEGATQLDVLALDDTQTRLQLAQGRLDVKSFAMDARQPYEIVTPRGTVKLLQQGDYYVEAGSTEDATRLGVRSGAAQIQALNGQVLAVRANEVAEVMGDGSAPVLRTIKTAPPTPPAYWASRDRQIVYDRPQYLPAGVTGYEDLNAYGDWIDDGSYGRVWAPREVPSGWAPYRTGHWAYVKPWGWTWIDEQPWGFAPYHYGRWANRGNRWVWVPPQRDVRPVYAPALVAFVGGVELAVSLGNQTAAAPVGWFPLGPREVYVPSYTTDREYYRRLNRSARIEDRILEDRWQRAQRREAYVAARDQALTNQRFATVVPATTFVRSQPVMRSALQVQPQAIAAAPVAPVAAPPAPNESIRRATAAPAAPQPAADLKAKAEAELKTENVPLAKTAIAAMPTLAKPAATEKPTSPGPKLATTQPRSTTDDRSRQAAPALAPRQGAAPPELKGAVTPAPGQPPLRPGEPPKQQQQQQQQAVPQPQARPDAPKPTEPDRQAVPQPQSKPAEPTRQQAAPQPQATPPTPPPQQGRPAAEPNQRAAPQPQQRPQAAPQPQPQQARPAAEPQNRAAPPQAAPQARPQQARPEQPRQEPQAAPPPTRPQQEGRQQRIEPPRQQAAPAQQQARPAPPPQQAAPPQQQQRQQAAPQSRPQPKPPEQAQSRPASQPDNKKDDKK